MRLLYIIWLLLPIALFLCFLWSALEGHPKGKRGERGDLWRSTLHTTVVVATTIVIHLYGITPLLGDDHALWWARTFADVATLPVCLIIASQLAGPSPVTGGEQSRRLSSFPTPRSSSPQKRQ